LKQAKILNENTQKYVDVPIVETLGGVVTFVYDINNKQKR